MIFIYLILKYSVLCKNERYLYTNSKLKRIKSNRNENVELFFLYDAEVKIYPLTGFLA